MKRSLNFKIKSNNSKIDEILKKYKHNHIENILPILQEVQEIFGYISKDIIIYISKKTGIPSTEILGVTSFYSGFKFNKPGKYIIKVCHGTACHVNGANHISEKIFEIIKIKKGETTNDGLFSLEEVACLGCCSLAPVIMINDKVYGKLDDKKLEEIFNFYKKNNNSNKKKIIK
jgi:NADH-quinone oxidoreductase subunit E